jgi:hypothetical protein
MRLLSSGLPAVLQRASDRRTSLKRHITKRTLQVHLLESEECVADAHVHNRAGSILIVMCPRVCTPLQSRAQPAGFWSVTYRDETSCIYVKRYIIIR